MLVDISPIDSNVNFAKKSNSLNSEYDFRRRVDMFFCDQHTQWRQLRFRRSQSRCTVSCKRIHNRRLANLGSAQLNRMQLSPHPGAKGGTPLEWTCQGPPQTISLDSGVTTIPNLTQEKHNIKFGGAILWKCEPCKSANGEKDACWKTIAIGVINGWNS